MTEFWPKIRSKYYFDRILTENLVKILFWPNFWSKFRSKLKILTKNDGQNNISTDIFGQNLILTENFGQKFGHNFLTDRSKTNFDQRFSDRWFSVKNSVKMANFGQNYVFFRSKLNVNFVVIKSRTIIITTINRIEQALTKQQNDICRITKWMERHVLYTLDSINT